jgi:hypothetical protein
MSALHHSDIVTYALTRLASDYARSKQEILGDLRRLDTSASRPPASFPASFPNSTAPSSAFPIRAPRTSVEEKFDE